MPNEIRDITVIRELVENLRDDFEKLNNSHSEIKTALMGDMTGKPGAMQHLVRVMEDIYGTENNRAAGMKPRLEKIEQQTSKWIWSAAGAMGVITVLFEIYRAVSGKAH